MDRPNLFGFATSELSQDAFLCWLAALARADDPDLANVGRTFIAWLWRTAKGEVIQPHEVQLLQEPERQWRKIDIKLEVIVKGTGEFQGSCRLS